MPEQRALIALGANLPRNGRTPRQALAQAIERLSAATGSAVRPSRLYRTPAYPPGSGPDFVNAAAEICWSDSAEALLAVLHDIEEEFGRTRTARWEARIMDLDLIALGQAVLPDMATQRAWAGLPPERAARETPGELILPHPRLADRGFVLVPLAEIAPDWRHPVTGVTVAEMLAARPDEERSEIRPLPVMPDDDAQPSPLSFSTPDDR